MSLKTLDEALQQLAAALAQAFGDQPWDRLRYTSRWTPTGDVGSDDFWPTFDGAERKMMPNGLSESLRVPDAAKRHWTLGGASRRCPTLVLPPLAMRTPYANA